MTPYRIPLRIALRGLRASTATGLLASAVLALGIGAVLLVSMAAEGLLLRPLPYPDPDALVVVRGTAGDEIGGVSLLDFRDVRQRARSLSSAVAYRRRSFLLGGDGDPGSTRVIQTALSTGGLPETLGVTLAAGRDFDPAEERDGAAVTLLAWPTARALFGEAATAPDRSILLNDVAHTVVGVLPPGLELWVDGQLAEAIVPLDPALYGRSRDIRSLTVVGRLADDAGKTGATEELTAIGERLESVHPDTNSGHGFAVQSLHEFLRGDNRSPLILLSLGAFLLLTSAVVNAGSLLLERTLSRAREIGVRVSLGAGTADLAGLFLAEAAIIVGLGLVAGIVLAAAALRLLPWVLETLGGAPEILAMSALAPRPGAATIVLTGLLCALVVLALGLGLAVVARRAAPLSLIQFGPETAGGNRLRRLLVVGQVALSVTLLLAASLLGMAFLDLASTDPGFRVDDVTRFGIGIPAARYPTEQDRVDFHRRLESRLAEIPGVVSAGIVADLPLRGSGYGTWYMPAEIELPRTERPSAGINVASPGYFRALEIPLLRGRLPDWTDTPESPRVMVIDEALADEWPWGDPLGDRVRIGWRSGLHPPGSEWEIVGVVGSVRHRGLGEPPRPTLYLSAGQYPLDGGSYVLRSRPGSAPTAAVVADAVHDLDPDLQRVEPGPLRRRLADSLGTERTALTFAGGLAALALALTGIGVYGLMAVDAARRRREMAIRLALGATPGRVAAVLLGSGLRTAAAGITLGILLFVPLAGLLRERLHDVPPTDPLAVGAAVLVGTIACLAATLPPARRAGATLPARAMREP